MPTTPVPPSASPVLGRRAVLGLGAAAAATGALGADLLSSGAHAAGARPWPHAALPASALRKVDTRQFISKGQLAAWGAEADALGLRATGAGNHAAYLRTLRRRFERAGLRDVRLEPVPMKRWLAQAWSLEVAGETVPYTYYMPYTQQTPADGVTAPLVLVDSAELLEGTLPDVAGKIAVFEVPYVTFPLAGFQLLSYPGGFDAGGRDRSGTYSRPWFNSNETVIDTLIAAGASGVVGIWAELPKRWGQQYTPYDGVFRPAPGLWVDATQGPALKDKAGNGATATIKLQAAVADVVSHNLVGFIPGRSKELTVLHTHTDGTNGMEENGQIGILATAQYLARLPRRALERTVMVVLSTGHFSGGVGIRRFLDVHATNLVPRITSILTLEHLGCEEWLPDDEGVIRPTGLTELGAWFTPNAPGLVDAVVADRARVGIAGAVDRPFVPAPAGSAQPMGWPGEGTYWWRLGSIPTANYITGPYGLITAGLKTHHMVDYGLMRRIAMSTVRTVADLNAASRNDLRVLA